MLPKAPDPGVLEKSLVLNLEFSLLAKSLSNLFPLARLFILGFLKNSFSNFNILFGSI